MKRTHVMPDSVTAGMEAGQIIAAGGEGTARVPEGSPWQSPAVDEFDDESADSYW